MTKANATLIDHILTNDFLDTASSTGTVKSDILDHFPIFLITSVQYLYSLTDTNIAYEYFLRTFSGLYNHAFLIKEVSLKLKNVFNPWMTKGLQKSSKKKQKLYDKFHESKTNKN